MTRGQGVVNGAKLTEGALLDSGKSSYRGPASTPGGGSAPAPQRIREGDGQGDGVGISAGKSCVM